MGGDEVATAAQQTAPRAIPWLRVGVGAAALIGLVALGRGAGGYVPEFAAWVEELGFWGPAVFALAYVVATVAFVPGSLLTLAAGAIFGVIEGTVLVFFAATVGACLAFLVSRHAARSAIEHRVAGNEKFAAIDRAVAVEGRKIVLLLRLSPVFPFNLLNYALGLTQIRFWDYAIASVGMLPGTLLYVYYGALAGEVAALAGGAAVQKDASYYAVLGIGLVATIAVTTFVTRTARRALREVTGE
ncbi:MAG: TVP38/TMEM64 family protein [Myxococcota bacterium]